MSPPANTFDLARRQWRAGAGTHLMRADADRWFIPVWEGPHIIALVPAWKDGANLGPAAVAALLAGAPRLLAAAKAVLRFVSEGGTAVREWDEVVSALEGAVAAAGNHAAGPIAGYLDTLYAQPGSKITAQPGDELARATTVEAVAAELVALADRVARLEARADTATTIIPIDGGPGLASTVATLAAAGRRAGESA